MPDDKLNTALQAEYLHLQKTIEDFDSRALTIKAWSVSFSLVAIGGAFASHSSIPFLISAVSAFIFWVLELHWKLFQVCYYPRSRQLEAHFRSEIPQVDHPFQISTSWYEAWQKIDLAEILHIAKWPHVALPHFVVLLIGVILFVLASAQIIVP